MLAILTNLACLFAVKLGIGGFSMGAATALYSATCFAQGKYGNGYPYPVNLRAIVGLSGWLPGARCDSTPSHPLKNKETKLYFVIRTYYCNI